MKTAYSFLDFAIDVLKHCDSPMTANEVWGKGVKMNLHEQLSAKGKTPEQTLMACLYVAAKKASQIISVGEKPKRFKLADGVNVEVLPKPPQDADIVVKPIKGKTYSFKECALKVLEQFGNKKPMHIKDITDKAIEMGWLVSEGSTPQSSMFSQLVTEIQHRQKRGEAQRFVKHGHGYFGLSRWMSKGLRFQIEEHNKDVCKRLREYLMTISPKKFEELIGRLLIAMGYEDSQVTGRSGDGGIDVRGTWVVTEGIRIKMAVQVKRWKHNVTRPIVQALRGSISTNERGLIITTSDFPESAKEEADDPTKASPISLINGERLVRLLVEYNIGITRESIEILELDTESIESDNV